MQQTLAEQQGGGASPTTCGTIWGCYPGMTKEMLPGNDHGRFVLIYRSFEYASLGKRADFIFFLEKNAEQAT